MMERVVSIAPVLVKSDWDDKKELKALPYYNLSDISEMIKSDSGLASDMKDKKVPIYPINNQEMYDFSQYIVKKSELKFGVDYFLAYDIISEDIKATHKKAVIIDKEESIPSGKFKYILITKQILDKLAIQYDLYEYFINDDIYDFWKSSDGMYNKIDEEDSSDNNEINSDDLQQISNFAHELNIDED